MNKERRKRIAEAVKLIENAAGILEEVREDELESYDNLPEGLQNSERGEQMRENIDTLEKFINNLEEADSLTDLLAAAAASKRR